MKIKTNEMVGLEKRMIKVFVWAFIFIIVIYRAGKCEIVNKLSTEEICKMTRIKPQRILYVDKNHPDASDENPGTKKRPWLTLQHAGKTAKAGDKVVIMAGVYRGWLLIKNSGLPNKPIIFEGVSLGKVILKGDDPVKNWKRIAQDSPVWMTECRLSVQAGCGAAAGEYSKYHTRADEAELMVDGHPLFWSSGKNLPPGCWNVDRKNNVLYVRLADDTDPNSHEMEVIARYGGVAQVKDPIKNIVIRNLVVRRFIRGIMFSNYNQNIVIENNIIEWCVCAIGTWWNMNIVVQNNMVQWNGFIGIEGFGHYTRFIENKMMFNNWMMNAGGYHSAGIKHCLGVDNEIIRNECAYNGGLGIWTDIWVHKVKVIDNIVHDNANNGLEDEISGEGLWKGNISYRNLHNGLWIYASSRVKAVKNLLADNMIGMMYNFRRSRVNSIRDPKLLKSYNIENRFNRLLPEKRKEEWRKHFLKYQDPCGMVSDNLLKKNLLMNNGVAFINPLRLQLTDPKEAYMISGNTFKDNVIINKNPSKAVGGYPNLSAYQKETKDGKGCLYFTTFEERKLPAWARKLYKKHKSRLNYPRSYQSIKNIIEELKVRNCAVCSYFNGYISPAGLLAQARICESELLEEKKFSDPFLKAYFISYKGKRTLVLWRKHGRPFDYLPLLLNGLSAETFMETAWGEHIPIKKQNRISSVNVGTWPVYLVGCPENITQVQPFECKLNRQEKPDATVELTLSNFIDKGELYIDKCEGIKECPRKVKVTEEKVIISLKLEHKPGKVVVRVAGYLGELYAGRIFRFSPGKKTSTARKRSVDVGHLLHEKFIPIPITSVANCNLDDTPPLESFINSGKEYSLRNLPEHLSLGNISFIIKKKGPGCIGLAGRCGKTKRPENVGIELGGKKFKALAFLHVLGYEPEEKGTPVIVYTLEYDDNLSESVQIESGVHLVDWWNEINEDQKKLMEKQGAYKVWSGDSGSGHEVHVYAYIWQNPYAGKSVKSLRINVTNAGKKTATGILAISGLKND